MNCRKTLNNNLSLRSKATVFLTVVFLFVTFSLPVMAATITTETFYPVLDGYIGTNPKETFALAVNAESGDWVDSAEAGVMNGVDNDGGYQAVRGYYVFNTTSIPDTATITSAMVSLRGSYQVYIYGNGTLNVYSSNPTSMTVLATSDYNHIGNTPFSTTISATVFSTAAYNDFVLNAAGKTAINATGFTMFSTRINQDVAGVYNNSTRIDVWSSEAETGNPKLTVTYSTPVNLAGLFPGLVPVLLIIPLMVMMGTVFAIRAVAKSPQGVLVSLIIIVIGLSLLTLLLGIVTILLQMTI
jgi:hypothetical protein